MDRRQLICKKDKEVPREENPIYLSSQEDHIQLSSSLVQYLSSPECNLDNICRICLIISKEPLYTLSSSNEGNSFADMFQKMTSIQMSREDGLPTRVCLSCQAEVMRFAKFKTKCDMSDDMLKTILKGVLSTECETLSQSNHVHAEKQDVQNIKNEYSKHLDLIGYKEYDDCSEELQNVLSDDEALFIVQNTFKNEKKITIYDRGPKKQPKNIGTKSKKKKYKHDCSFCAKGFNTLRLLKAHENKYHGCTDDPFPCDRCKETFASEGDFKLHALLHDRIVGPWECTNCQKLFQDKPLFRRHIQRHMQRKKFTCEECGKMFVERYALRRHSRVHTGQQPEKKHACTHCGKRFIDNGQLTAHMSHHGGEKAFQCIVCGKAFAAQRLLTSHLVVHSELKPHACLYCDKRFRHESTRNTHHRTHTGERPYVCSTCGKTFIQNSNLRLHMRTHTGERPYSCGQCGRKFSSGSTLKMHERTHSGERPYSCNICGKRFARASMNLHMSVHSGVRPFACAACPRRFRGAALLREHMRTHTGEEPFECAKCKSTYASKVLLIKHLKKHENDKRHRKRKPPQLPTSFVKPPQLPTSFVKPPQLPTSFVEPPQLEAENKNYVDLPIADEIPNAIMELTLGTHETFNVREDLIFQDNNVKTHVIVLGTNTNTVSFVSDGVDSGLNIVTIDEIGVSISSNTDG